MVKPKKINKVRKSSESVGSLEKGEGVKQRRKEKVQRKKNSSSRSQIQDIQEGEEVLEESEE